MKFLWNLKTEQLKLEKQIRKKFVILLFAMLAGASACIGVNELLKVSGLTVLFRQEMNEVTQILYQNQLWKEILTVGIMIPFAEELIYRGLVYAWLKRFLPVWAAAGIDIFVFAVLHGNVIQGIYAFLVGILIIWVYEATKQFLAAAVVHISANLVSVFVSEIAILKMGVEEWAVCLCPLGLMLTGVFCLAIWHNRIIEEGE